MMQVGLREVGLPEFGMPTTEPVVLPETYGARIAAARARMRERDLAAIVVYGDREHTANLAYLTGFDPRFEEAMLVLTPGDGPPALLLGNEGWGYADISPVDLRKVRYQSFSLLSQSRDDSAPLAEILANEGIGRGDRVGSVGWKYFTAADGPDPEHRLEIPSYIADTLRRHIGDPALVVNAGDIFMDAEDGLRVINEVDQLAVFEYAACHTSDAVRRVLQGLRPGMTEHEAVQLMQWNGIPLSCHLMLSSGPRAFMGLPSPTARRIERGDPFTTAFGLWGALNCRAGWVIADENELPADIRDYLDKLVAPYYTAIVSWYEAIGLGVPGHVLHDLVHRHVGDPFFGVHLNPGHQLHLDEWVNTPIAPGCETPLRSGMAFQVDVIPATGTPYFTTNIEDGIALADEDLRARFAADYPEAWGRIEARRTFMADALGIRLKPEVLPFSNIPAYLPPFLLRPDRVMAVTGRNGSAG